MYFDKQIVHIFTAAAENCPFQGAVHVVYSTFRRQEVSGGGLSIHEAFNDFYASIEAVHTEEGRVQSHVATPGSNSARAVVRAREAMGL